MSDHLVTPVPNNLNIIDPINVKSPMIITGDWHVPMVDYGLINRMIDDARDRKITTLGIAGDFFNFDSLSTYDPKQTDHTLEEEIEQGRDIMSTLLKTFKEIVYTWGNHDNRLARTLGYKMAYSTSMKYLFGELHWKQLAKIRFSDLDYFLVDTPRGVYRVCHPANYTRNPLTSARKLSAKYGTHVITAHSHHHAVGYAEDGLHAVAEIGGMFDTDKIAYLNRSTTFPRWQSGYCIVDKQGVLNMVGKDWVSV